jgi:hypothetical protein
MADPLASSWNPVTFKTEYEPKPGPLTTYERGFALKFAAKLGVDIPPPDTLTRERAIIRIATLPEFTFEHSVLLGEALNGCRASLDYLAWVLVKRQKAKLTAAQEGQIAFPVVRKRKDFFSSCHNRNLRGVPDKPFLTLFERYQPYKRTPVGRTMRALWNLSDIDKHRFVIPILTPFEVEVSNSNSKDAGERAEMRGNSRRRSPTSRPIERSNRAQNSWRSPSFAGLATEKWQ